MKRWLALIWLLCFQPFFNADTQITLNIQSPVLTAVLGDVLRCHAATLESDGRQGDFATEPAAPLAPTGSAPIHKKAITLAVTINSDTVQAGDFIRVEITAYQDRPEHEITLTQPPKVALLGPDGAMDSNLRPVAVDKGYTVTIATQGRPAGHYWLQTTAILTDAPEAVHSRNGFYLTQANDLNQSGIGPQTFALHQNYPNPFNPGTTITFDLPVASRIEIEIFNTLGQSVRKLINAHASMGTHTVQWDGNDVSGNKLGTGIYYCYFKASAQNGSGFENFIKMILIR